MNKQTSIPAKAPDNNKRLAALEAGVSALAIALDCQRRCARRRRRSDRGRRYRDQGSRQQSRAQVAQGRRLSLAHPLGDYGSGRGALARLDTLGEHIKSLEATIAAGPTNATEGEIAAIARAEKAEGELTAELEEIKELKPTSRTR
jgi:hypothetical protein